MRVLSAFLIVTLLAVTVNALPASAQENTWCYQWDFSRDRELWTLSESNTHGAYTLGTGFHATDYGGTDYDTGRSIRIHRDLSATVTDMTLLLAYSTQEETLYLRTDYDSEVGSGDYDERRIIPVRDDPVVVGLGPQEVDSRLGIELVNSTFLGTDTPLTSVIVALRLEGSGVNPFSESNCQVDINAPFNQLLTVLQNANNAINSLPSNPLAPNGVSLIPDTSALMTVFGILKWLTSPNVGEEIAGPFGILLYHLGLALLIIMAFWAIYVVVWVVMTVARFVLRFIRFLVDAFNAIWTIGSTLISGGLGAVLKLIRIGG